MIVPNLILTGSKAQDPSSNGREKGEKKEKKEKGRTGNRKGEKNEQ